MYGYSPYGSYSSMSSVAQPMDIAQSSYLSHNSAYHASCAYPSWPQRSSLTESNREERATSYLSDDDLFPCEVSDDDAHSVSSAGSTTATSPSVSDEELVELQNQKMAMQREAMKFLVSEKERRRQQAKRQRRSSSGSKKGPKSQQSHMASITEAGE